MIWTLTKKAVRAPKVPFVIKPNVPKFSDPRTSNEWKVKIESMMKSGIYHQDVLRQAIRNSIAGKPRKVLTTLKPDASLQEILET
ncbi:hypothetical protein DPMN_060054 [Dreissena polymorpha]|uniref:Uncharacterized protein n=1 Tax=Dreissena polymorpha TaxID=45954 RepID=A0A9D4HFL6_DREPO|nr:hypothetical protein DPMN_060054 [Dreissena polymorpha]